MNGSQTDAAVESAARALYRQEHRSAPGYSWDAATETVRNEYRVRAHAARGGREANE